MRVGILGSGVVAQTLAVGFLKYGYEVTVGTMHPDKLKEWAEKNSQAKIGSFSDAAKFGDILVLAVKGAKAQEVLRQISEEIRGKTIVDVTNPIADEPPVNGVLKFFTSLEDSLMERLQREFLEANFVKAFNSVGHAFMVDPNFGGVKPTMCICGNNEDSKKIVWKIVEQFGFEVEDMGKAEAARAIEPLCMLWCIPGFLRRQWSHAFKIMKNEKT